MPLAVLVAAAAVIFAGLALGRLSLGGPLGIHAVAPKAAATSAGPSLRLIPIASAHDEDPPPGDGSEHPELVGRAIDGNPGTWWITDHYKTAAFGNLKTGVGLWLDFGTTAEVRTVTITSPVPGWTFQLFGTPDPTGAPLSSPGGRTSFSANERTVTVTLRPERTGGVLIWITGLAAVDHGFAAAVAEVSARGTG